MWEEYRDNYICVLCIVLDILFGFATGVVYNYGYDQVYKHSHTEYDQPVSLGFNDELQIYHKQANFP